MRAMHLLDILQCVHRKLITKLQYTIFTDVCKDITTKPKRQLSHVQFMNQSSLCSSWVKCSHTQVFLQQRYSNTNTNNNYIICLTRRSELDAQRRALYTSTCWALCSADCSNSWHLDLSHFDTKT